MKRTIALFAIAAVFAGCQKDKNEEAEKKDAVLEFSTKTYEKKTALPCKASPCAEVKIAVPEASGIPVVSDSINKKIFNTVRGIVYFGEKPSNGKNYEEVMATFISSYEQLKEEYEDERSGWEANIDGKVTYSSDKILNIKLHSYTFTGGAHGYDASRSLIFDKATGKSLEKNDILKDTVAFKVLAEKKFREKFKIPSGKPINSTGMMFMKEVFELPQTYFFTAQGLLLYYNIYEAAAYAEGPKEVLIPYSEAGKFLKVK
ncbi:MAG TPA: DUF3298 and DUF4163 domain-containing protein [Flavobacterium sp.]|nr:DUF3298 and DUF4163 domain-containing protein [Flavobacterium sp.]